jgi:dihydroorotate dehydrogenase
MGFRIWGAFSDERSAVRSWRDMAAASLRLLDPEDAHRLTLAALALGLGPVDRTPPDPVLAVRVAGLDLANPIGLAAGFDKDAKAPAALLRAGFGFVECGTTTPHAQSGNPRPRLFRLPEDRAVINRMGFNNAGHEAFAAGLSASRGPGVVGANLGANKDSQNRALDYVLGLQRLWPLADYFTLNVSSPNTPGLRDLQGKADLEDLLGAVGEARRNLAARHGPRPIFLKIAPDLTEANIRDVVEVAMNGGVDALIISNTTLARPAGLSGAARNETGGLSGPPLFAASTHVLRWARAVSGGRLALIGVGGIASAWDAYAKIRAGASALQLYTALAYEGPALVARLKSDLAALLRADGFRALDQAIGTA